MWKAAENWSRNRQYTVVFHGVASDQAALLFEFRFLYFHWHNQIHRCFYPVQWYSPGILL